MACVACGAELPASAKFCHECGNAQQATCGSCNASLPGNAKFCLECGAATGAAVAAKPALPQQTTSSPVAERRVCSVLFCDLVGFTPMSESRDPEEVRELLSRYFEVARTVIERYGGAVEKFIGDAVMAVWGAPIAAEGDSERAVRAALDVVEAVRELGREAGLDGLAARAGVVTGEVAVTVGATGQGMVAGDAVNTAARVQTTADPGAVLVDEGTWRVARGSVAFADAGEHMLKGKAEPARLWRAERVLSGVGGSQRVDGLEAPLVGRDAEMRLVKELFHACVERKSPRLVSVIGPPGVGKSRLGWEFFKYVDGLVELVRWHRGRCLSYGDGVAFWALAEMVRQRFGIAEDDTSTTMATKLEEGLERWVPDEATRDYVAPRLAQLIGVGSEATTLGRDELFAGWRVFFETMASVEPVVLLVEDLQYADSGLLDFIEHLLDWARNVPILVVTLARPEIADRRPGWGLGRRNSTALTLEPLDDAAMRAMLEGLVPGMPEAAATAIARQAQGMPLYAVETIRMLVDRDVVQPVDGVYRLVGDIGELTVPDTLQSLLTARLDALEPNARRLVADAAVLGGSFPAEALVAVSGMPADEVAALLSELVRREVLTVRADPLSPDRGQYAFVQTMFRQVAYDTLSRRERKTRHLVVAEHLARTFADDGEEVSEVIASHLLDALEAVPDDVDAPMLRDRAVNVLVRAAERAGRTAAHATAATAFARAAALEEEAGTPQGDASAAALLLRASSAAGDANAQADAASYAEHATELYERHGDEHSAARARITLGTSLRRLGRLGDAHDVLEQALASLEATPDEDTVMAMMQLSMVELTTGKATAHTLAHNALARAQELRLNDRALANLLVTVGMCANWANRRIEAIAFMREALHRAEVVQEHRQIVAAGLNLADTLCMIDAPAAAEVARSTVAHARRVGNRFLLPTAVANLVQALLLTGDWVTAEEECVRNRGDEGYDQMTAYGLALVHALQGRVDDLDELLAVVREHASAGDEQGHGIVMLTVAAVASARKEHLQALRAANEALETAQVVGCAHEAVRWSWSLAAEAALALGDLGETSRLLDWLDAFPVGHLATVQVVERDRIHAKLLAANGDPAALAEMESAVAAAREFGSPYHLALGLLDQAEHLAAGDPERAARLAAEAEAIGRRLGCGPVLARAGALTPQPMPVALDDSQALTTT